MEHKRRTLIIYDIVNDRRRYRLIKALESYGIRVQKSVFEAELSEKQWQELQKKVKPYIKLEEDAFRMYDLSECRREVLLGQNIVLQEVMEENFCIII